MSKKLNVNFEVSYNEDKFKNIIWKKKLIYGHVRVCLFALEGDYALNQGIRLTGRTKRIRPIQNDTN